MQVSFANVLSSAMPLRWNMFPNAVRALIVKVNLTDLEGIYDSRLAGVLNCGSSNVCVFLVRDARYKTKLPTWHETDYEYNRNVTRDTASKVTSFWMAERQIWTILAFLVSQPRKKGSKISGLSERSAAVYKEGTRNPVIHTVIHNVIHTAIHNI